MRPPNTSTHLAEHHAVEQSVLQRHRQRDRFAGRACGGPTSFPTAKAALKQLLLPAAPLLLVMTTRECAFSKMRGAAAMNVGLTTAVFCTILSTRPSTALAKPHAICADNQYLPERVRQRQPEQLQVVVAQYPQLAKRPPLRTPMPRAAAARPWVARSSPRCKSTSPIDPRRSVDGVADRLRMFAQILHSEIRKVVECHHPVTIAGALEHDHFVDVGQLGATSVSFASWSAFSANTNRDSESDRMYAVSAALVFA